MCSGGRTLKDKRKMGNKKIFLCLYTLNIKIGLKKISNRENARGRKVRWKSTLGTIWGQRAHGNEVKDERVH